MATNRRHTEWFGPDLLRSPALSGSPEVAGIQIASAIAQLRAPLSRDDTAIEAHVDFIRSLADKLFPDVASSIHFDVGTEAADTIETTIRVETGQYDLLRCWLADNVGGGLTATSPTSVAFTSGTIVQTLTSGKHYLVLVPKTGIVTIDVTDAGTNTWYWAAVRSGRVYYSTKLGFV